MCFIRAIDQRLNVDLMVTPKSLYRLRCSSTKNVFLDVFEKSNYLDINILESLSFFFFLTHFRVEGVVEREISLKE